MSLEFQLLTARLEDRLPLAFPASDRARVVEDPCAYDDGVSVDKDVAGCIAFLFGRDRSGRSVAVRIPGVRPKLYFEMKDGDGLLNIKAELERELGTKLRASDGGIVVQQRNLSHFYFYEPDDSSPSSRRVHSYAEASFPTLASFKETINVRRRHETEELRAQLEARRAQLAECESVQLAHRQEALRCGGGDAWNDLKLKAREAEETAVRLRDEVIPHLERRISKNSDDRDGRGGRAAAAADARAPRFAHEHFVEPLSRFFHEESIGPGGWIRIEHPRAADLRFTLCDVEVEAARGDCVAIENSLDAPYSLCYYDIETLGKDPADKPVIQVSLVFQQHGRPHEKNCVCVGTVDRTLVADANIIECVDEAELLRETARLIRRRDPDFLVAYYGVNFDNRYLGVRAGGDPRECQPETRAFWHLSRYGLKPARLLERRLQSAGMGDNRIYYFDLPGRTSLDWWVKLSRDPDLQSEPSYSLDHFAKKFCGDNKKPMHYSQIPVLQAGSPQDRALLAEYCVHDSYLLLLLNDARNMVVEIVRFAHVFGIICEWVFFRGQQVRYIAMLLRKVRTQEAVPMLINRPPGGFDGENDSEKYQGAIVVEPKRGFYKTCVAAVDFMSLYPSSMQANNLCPSTQVKDVELHGEPGVVAFEVSESRKTFFVSAKRHKGILPQIQAELGMRRSAAKKEMKKYAKAAKDAGLSDAERERSGMLTQIFNGTQLALKVASNSMYGSMGAGISGLCPNRAVAETTTYCGRWAMQCMRGLIDDEFPGTTAVYGDTDSLFLTFDGIDDVTVAMERGTAIATRVTDHLKEIERPLVLEMEKVYSVFLLLDKKRYAGLKYEEDADGSIACKGIDAKGVETERRDTLPFVKDILKQMMKDLFFDASPEQAMKSFCAFMDTMVADEVPFEKYIIRKKLSSKTEGKVDTIAQAKVNADRRAREAGSEAALNDYVEYVIVNGHKSEKTTPLAQDPVFARENGLKINRSWYFAHAIVNPVRKIFDQVGAMRLDAVLAAYASKLDAARLEVRDVFRTNLIAPPADPKVGTEQGGSSSCDGAMVVAAPPPRLSIAQRAAAIPPAPAPARKRKPAKRPAPPSDALAPFLKKK